MSYETGTGVINLWINPDSADFGGAAPAITLTVTDSGPTSSISRFLLRQDSTGETPFISFDELRMGTTWADVTPTDPLSVNQFDSKNFSVYPNPTNTGFVNITSASTDLLKAKVFDILGKQVIESNVVNNQLNVSGLNAGVYIIKLTQNNASTTKKLVIK